jgi:pyruvate/2-oxoglutarate dehydrogenase complex dihydrolipoamide dehydrogenase (E3) component
MAGREMEDPIGETSRKKRVLVLGGGPAGMQAALTAAERGHHVCLMEKSNELGGELILASKPPGKMDIAPFLGYLKNQINKKNIKIELEKELTQAWLEEYNPDAAIIATGSIAVMPQIEGLSRKRVYMPSEVLIGEEINGRRVLVIGGGTVGCEVAEFLCEKGKEVIIVEILDDLARDMDRINRLPLLLSLEAYGVRILTKTKVASVEDHGAWVVCLGKKEFIETDAIVVAAGKETRLEAVDEMIKSKVSEFYLVGDKARTGGILEAVRDGYEVAERI